MPVNLPDSPRATSPAALLSPSWTEPRRSYSNARASPYAQNRSTEIRDSLINTVEKLQRRTLKIVNRMSPLQRAIAALLLVLAAVTGLLFLIYSEQILQTLEPLAEKWKRTKGAWTILWAMTFVAAFPPMIGYSTCGTIAGFVYGVGEGWLIYATATVVGSYCSFIVSRTVLRSYVERMVANDRRFAALTLTLKEDGLKLLCMIRLCPLPYSLSNGAMSTFPTVHPSMYALATAIISPKLLIHVFIGSRLAKFGSGNMSTGMKIFNWVSIITGGLIGAFTGWFIYRKTMARARELESEEARNVRESVRRTGAPPREYVDDPEAQQAAETLAQEDDGVAYFDDAPSPLAFHEETDDEDVFSKADEESGKKPGSDLQRKA